MKSNSPTTKICLEVPEHFSRDWVEKQAAGFSGTQGDLHLNLAKTVYVDSAAASWVGLLHRSCQAQGSRLVLQNVSAEVLGALRKWTLAEAEKPADKKKHQDRSKEPLSVVAVGAASILTEMLYWGTVGLLRRRDIKKGALVEQMYQLGYRAMGIVCLLSFLIGVVLALQSAMQLRQFGADIFLAPMIGVSMIRELGPLLTAIILAGRSGSATTAEIATMGVQEEIDALQTLSINPVQFVVVPKFWAISLTMPLLSVLATASGILGGFLVAIFYLGTASRLFLGELSKYIFLGDVVTGLLKSLVFSWLIVWIGSFYGFRVRGGAEEVGRATTSSVVACIFVIIIADALFSFIL